MRRAPKRYSGDTVLSSTIAEANWIQYRAYGTDPGQFHTNATLREMLSNNAALSDARSAATLCKGHYGGANNWTATREPIRVTVDCR